LGFDRSSNKKTGASQFTGDTKIKEIRDTYLENNMVIYRHSNGIQPHFNAILTPIPTPYSNFVRPCHTAIYRRLSHHLHPARHFPTLLIEAI
jgi:hypothetical protein